MPEIDRYEALRPALALLGPNLPDIDVPFQIPEGYGGRVFSTEGEEPTVFDEEFTGTTSWRFDAVREEVPVTGRYYVVAYIPGGDDGKFWMALGEEEVFGLEDILTLPSTLFQVRQFHEVFPFGGLLGWLLLVLLAAVVGLFSLWL